MSKPIVIIVGKLPPPFIGPAIATQIILNSTLQDEFELIHLDTTVNQTIEAFGKGGIKKIGKNLSIYLKLIKLIQKHKVDLIQIPISQTTMGFLKDSLFILIASIFSVKILLQLRGSNFKNWLNTSSNFTKSYVRFCLTRTKGIIVLGNNLKHLFEDYFSEEKIFVVPNGCDIKFLESDSLPELSKVQLLYFSNLLESKGIMEVLEAIKVLKIRGVSNIHLNAVGAWYDMDFKKNCISFVEKNMLPVTFHQSKSKNEKWKSFSNADIFVFTPNQPEGHPWSIIEALAAKLPIISTNQGAIIESVIDNENGYIVDNKSPKQIAEKLEKLIFDEALRMKMGQLSFIHYQKNFTEKSMVNNLTRTYNKLISTID